MAKEPASVPKTPAAQEAGTITLEQAARLLMISDERVRQLVKEGYIPKTARNTYPLVGVVQGYIRSLKDDEKRSSKTASASALQDARRREIELRTLARDRELVDIDEVVALFQELAGIVVSGLSGLPARVTRDVVLRRKIEAQCDEIRKQFVARFGKGVDPSGED